MSDDPLDFISKMAEDIDAKYNPKPEKSAWDKVADVEDERREEAKKKLVRGEQLDADEILLLSKEKTDELKQARSNLPINAEGDEDGPYGLPPQGDPSETPSVADEIAAIMAQQMGGFIPPVPQTKSTEDLVHNLIHNSEPLSDDEVAQVVTDMFEYLATAASAGDVDALEISRFAIQKFGSLDAMAKDAYEKLTKISNNLRSGQKQTTDSVNAGMESVLAALGKSKSKPEQPKGPVEAEKKPRTFQVMVIDDETGLVVSHKRVDISRYDDEPWTDVRKALNIAAQP